MTEIPSSPTEIARSYLAAFDGRDPDRIAAHVAPDFVNEHTSVLGSSCVGRTEYRARLSGFLDQIPALHYEVDSIVATGPEVAVFYTMTGRWHGERNFSIRGVQRLRVEHGDITQRTDYWDSAGFLLQVEDDPGAVLSALDE